MSGIDVAQLELASEKKTWFIHDRFGMFIHWGLYSQQTHGEWARSRKELRQEEYLKYLENFSPDLYDPKDWARRAKAAGMTHMTLTAKHHDGFCLWPSAETDFTVANTPHGEDLIRPFVEACRGEGLRVGLYFSLIDWSHRDFEIDVNHPLRNQVDFEEYNKECDVPRYQSFMKAQLREILTEYGRIDHLFMDYSYPRQTFKGRPGKGREYWDSEGLLKLVRELQPDAVLNNRMDLLDLRADFYTPECFVPNSPPTRDGEFVEFEAAFNLNDSWCYNRDHEEWKSPHQLIQILVNMVSLGGNLLMNIGPNGRGQIDENTKSALDAYGDWFRLHGRSIYGCGRSEFPQPQDGRLTQNGDRVYVHLFNWPYKHLYLPGLGGKVRYAQLLNDASEITWLPPGKRIVGEGEGLQGLDDQHLAEDLLIMQLPTKKPPVEVPVIEIFLK